MADFTSHPKLSMPPVRQVAFVAVLSDRLDYDSFKSFIIENYATSFPQKQLRKKIEYVENGDGYLETQESPPPDDQPHFRVSDAKASIIIGPRYFSYDIDESYSGWKEFSHLVSELIASLYKHGATGFKFISLRYENEILVKGEIEDTLGEWLIPKKIPFEEIGNPFAFDTESTSEFVDGVHRIRVDYPNRFDVDDESTEFVSIAIDHSFIPSEDSATMSADDLLEWVEIAHERIYATFNISLTEDVMAEIK